MAKIIMIDIIRNKVVGQFNSTKEALKYAKEEGIKSITLDPLKGASEFESK